MGRSNELYGKTIDVGHFDWFNLVAYDTNMGISVHGSVDVESVTFPERYPPPDDDPALRCDPHV